MLMIIQIKEFQVGLIGYYTKNKKILIFNKYYMIAIIITNLIIGQL